MNYYKQGTPYWWLNEESISILNGGYLLEGETPQSVIEGRISDGASKRYPEFPEFKERISEIIAKGWVSLSSPVWANLGTKRGLPISCFNVTIPDSVVGISNKLQEVIMQTKGGGGTSGYFGDLRESGAPITNNGESNGPMPFISLFDKATEVISQGTTRRGGFCAYIDVEHPDIKDFLKIRSAGNPVQTIVYGVNVSNAWMQSMIDGDQEKRDIWFEIMVSRKEKGMPFIFFTDNVNNNKPQVYKDLNLKIKSSNLCTEIMLPSSDLESFVCCLLSMNLALYDEWKDTDAVKYVVMLLDAIMQEFIENAKGMVGYESALNFAERHRALGLGVMGLHSYFQKNNISFESLDAKGLNYTIFKDLKEKAYEASEMLGDMYGHAPIFYDAWVTERPRRNTTLIAIAPTTSSSAILGQVSPGIEPFAANVFKAGLAKGNFMRKNVHLADVLEKYGKNTDEIWKDIMFRKGSVQHLDFLSEQEKKVFKTFDEISQMDIIISASIRQQHIDQGQSLNLNIPEDTSLKDRNNLIIEAWKLGLKSLYYQRSNNASKDLLVNALKCSSCEA